MGQSRPTTSGLALIAVRNICYIGFSIVTCHSRRHIDGTASIYQALSAERLFGLPPFGQWSAKLDLSIKRLRYNARLGQVQVGMAGELGERWVEIAIRFPFRAGEPPKIGIREVALLEAQQILQAAAIVSLPSLLQDDAPRRPPTTTKSSRTRKLAWCRGAA
jgi:hypothetical protein